MYHHICTDPGPSSIDDITVQGFRDLLEINLISNFTASKVYILITRSYFDVI
jgi:hypothetical protein